MSAFPVSPFLRTGGGPLRAGRGEEGSGAAWRQAPVEGACWDLSLSFPARTGGGAGPPSRPWGCGGWRGRVVLAVADQELMEAVKGVDQRN